ncbi:YceD family protein [Bacillus sp. N9]
MNVPIDVRSIETFLLQPLDYELGEMEIVHEADGGNINLIPVVEELLLLEVPLQVFSEDAMNGSTQVGRGWEVMTEEQFYNKQELAKKK